MKIYGGVEAIDPHILNPDSRWRWVVNFSPRALKPGVRAFAAHRIGG
jgi:hypothetical protein